MNTTFRATVKALLTAAILLVLVNGCKECAEEGEIFSLAFLIYPDHCCEGLTEWDAGFDTRVSIVEECYETGLEAGVPYGICINCYNEICEDIEDVCNCPDDCADGQNSEYNSVDEFCESELWNQILSPLCEESQHYEDLPICDVCG